MPRPVPCRYYSAMAGQVEYLLYRIWPATTRRLKAAIHRWHYEKMEGTPPNGPVIRVGSPPSIKAKQTLTAEYNGEKGQLPP